MYVDFRNDWPPPGPWEPKPSKGRLTRRQETVLVWIVCFNLLILLLAPVAGVTLFDALMAWVRD